MTTTVHRDITSDTDMIGAIRVLQAYLGRPVSTAIDDYSLQSEIIKIQTYLSTVVAAGQPSGFKFDPTKINKSIDDQYLSARLIQVQVAADLT